VSSADAQSPHRHLGAVRKRASIRAPRGSFNLILDQYAAPDAVGNASRFIAPNARRADHIQSMQVAVAVSLRSKMGRTRSRTGAACKYTSARRSVVLPRQAGSHSSLTRAKPGDRAIAYGRLTKSAPAAADRRRGVSAVDDPARNSCDVCAESSGILRAHRCAATGGLSNELRNRTWDKEERI